MANDTRGAAAKQENRQELTGTQLAMIGQVRMYLGDAGASVPDDAIIAMLERFPRSSAWSIASGIMGRMQIDER